MCIDVEFAGDVLWNLYYLNGFLHVLLLQEVFHKQSSDSSLVFKIRYFRNKFRFVWGYSARTLFFFSLCVASDFFLVALLSVTCYSILLNIVLKSKLFQVAVNEIYSEICIYGYISLINIYNLYIINTYIFQYIFH